VLYACCEVIRIVSIILFPVMPRKMREVRSVFALDDSTLSLDCARRFFDLTPGTPMKVEQPIFPRIDTPFVAGASAEARKTEPKTAEPVTVVTPDALLDFSEFQKLDLRVARVLTAEKVEGAAKLLKLQIDLGTEQRQIVAGIAEHYSPEQVAGTRIIVVSNLKPAVIRGVESRGMLLAAKAGKDLFLIRPDGDLPPGAKVS